MQYAEGLFHTRKGKVQVKETKGIKKGQNTGKRLEALHAPPADKKQAFAGIVTQFDFKCNWT